MLNEQIGWLSGGNSERGKFYVVLFPDSLRRKPTIVASRFHYIEKLKRDWQQWLAGGTFTRDADVVSWSLPEVRISTPQELQSDIQEVFRGNALFIRDSWDT